MFYNSFSYFQPTDAKQQKISNFFTLKPVNNLTGNNVKHVEEEIKIMKQTLEDDVFDLLEVGQNSSKKLNRPLGKQNKVDKDEGVESNNQSSCNPIQKLCLKCLQASPKTETPFCNHCNQSSTNPTVSFKNNEKVNKPFCSGENVSNPSKLSLSNNKLSDSPDLIPPTPPLCKKNDKQSKSVKRKFSFTEVNNASKKISLSKESDVAKGPKEAISDIVSPVISKTANEVSEGKENNLKPLKRNPFSKTLSKTSVAKTSNPSELTEHQLKKDSETLAASQVSNLLIDMKNTDFQNEVSIEYSIRNNANEVSNIKTSKILIENPVDDKTNHHRNYCEDGTTDNTKEIKIILENTSNDERDNLKINYENQKENILTQRVIDSDATSTSEPILEIRTETSLSEVVCVGKDKTETKNSLLNKCDDFNDNLLDDLSFFETSQTE